MMRIFIFLLLLITPLKSGALFPSNRLLSSFLSSTIRTTTPTWDKPVITSQDYDDASDGDYPGNNNGNGFRSEFVMGRDKELFHAALDLGWLYNTIVNKHTWQMVFSRVWQRICRISVDYNRKVVYREGILRLAAQLKVLNPLGRLRFLQCSLLEAQQFALKNKKFIVYYMEEHVVNEATPSLETVLFRNALTQNGIVVSEGLSNELEFGALDRVNLTDVLNTKFLLMASDHEHPYAQHIQSLLSTYYSSLMDDRSHPGHAQAAFAMAVSEMQFPMMVVVAPSAADYEAYNTYRRELDQYNDAVEEIQQGISDPYLRKKRLKSLKSPKYSPKKTLNLEVLGVMRLNTELILETLYDRKSPDRKTYDVSELVIQFLEKVQLEHKDRLENYASLKNEVENCDILITDEDEVPSRSGINHRDFDAEENRDDNYDNSYTLCAPPTESS